MIRSAVRPVIATVTAVAAVLLTVVAPASAAPKPYPVSYDALGSFIAGSLVADVPPPGANIRTCHSATHPTPVILVHGFSANQNGSWRAIAPILANDGYCVFTLNMGQTSLSRPLGIGHIESLSTSATQLSTFADQVRVWTGAQKVDLITHSAGGAVANILLHDLNGATKVRHVINVGGGLSGFPEVHGMAMIDIPALKAPLLEICPGCGDLDDRDRYQSLKAPIPHVRYTNIATMNDELVTPYRNAHLPAAPNVANITVQKVCPGSIVGHIGLLYDRGVITMIRNSLDPDRRRPVRCEPGFPL